MCPQGIQAMRLGSFSFQAIFVCSLLVPGLATAQFQAEIGKTEAEAYRELTSGASGIGEETTVTFNTLSQSAGDYKTVVATCNNEMSVNVAVFDLEVILEPNDNFQGRSLVYFGVEEEITLQHDKTPDGVAVDLEWVKVNGIGRLDENRFDAGAVPGQASIRLQVAAGPSAGMGPTCSLNVIAPSGAYMIQQPGTNIKHVYDTCSAGFLGISFMLPMHVSFSNLMQREGMCAAIASGYYGSLNGEIHHAGEWWYVFGGNIETGCRTADVDECYSREGCAPYAEGEFLWPIPWQYKGDDDVSHVFVTANQHITANSAGRCEISKLSAGPFGANALDPTTDY